MWGNLFWRCHMPKSRKKQHGSGKKPTPRIDALTLGDRLHDALSREELEALEREIRNLMAKEAEEARQLAAEQAFQRHWAISMRVLRDRFGWGGQRLRKLWDACLDYLKDMDGGLITAEEMLETLENEDGIRITWRTG